MYCSLKAALTTSCVAIAMLTGTANGIELTNDPTIWTWTEDGLPPAEYTGVDGDYYMATNKTWKIESGDYGVSTTNHTAIRLYNSHLSLEKDTSLLVRINEPEIDSEEGIVLDNGSTLTNKGNIDIMVDTAHWACGFYLYRDNCVLTNEAGASFSVTAKGEQHETSFIMGMDGFNGKIINRGDFYIGAQSIAGDQTVGITVGEQFLISNEKGGVMRNETIAGGSALTVSYSITDGSTLYNAGTLYATSVCDFMAVGVTTYEGGIIRNAGEMIATVSAGLGIGIAAETGTWINEAQGIIRSYGKDENSNNIGIGLVNGSTFYNSGVIEAPGIHLYRTMEELFGASPLIDDLGDITLPDTGTGNRFYLLDGTSLSTVAEAANQTFVISGKTEDAVMLGGTMKETENADGTVTRAVYANAQGSHATSKSNLAITGVTLSLADHATLHMGGDLDLTGVTTNWGQRTLTVDNGGQQHTTTWDGVFKGSWSGSFAISEDGESGKYTLTQKSTEEKIALSGAAVKLAEGKLTATQELLIGEASEEVTNLSASTDTLTLKSTGNATAVNATLSAKNIELSAGAGFMLKNVTLTQAEDGVGSLSNVTVTGDTSISGGSIVMDDVVIMLNNDNTISVVTVDTDAPALQLTSTLLSNVSVTGNLTLDFSAFASEEYDSVYVRFGEDTSFNLETAAIRGTANDTTYTASSVLNGNTVVFKLASVPEPATATLSLLGLAGLLLRRRRD